MSGFPRIGEQLAGLRSVGQLGASKSYSKKILSLGPVAYWKLNDLSGYRVKNYAPPVDLNSAQCVVNEGFEYPHSIRNFESWYERIGTGAIDDEGVLVHSGSHACKITRGADNNTWVWQYVAVEPNRTYNLSMWVRGDGGANAGRYAVYDETNKAFITSFTSTGVTAAAYSEVTDTFVTPAGCGVVLLYLACPPTAGVTYFDDIAITGLSTLDGWIPSAGVTYNVDGIGDGLTALRFNGTATYIRIGTPSFDSVFDGNLGWAVCWWRFNAAARWTDGVLRYPYHVRTGVDSLTYMTMGRPAANNTWGWRRRVSGGDTNEKTYNYGTGPLTWQGTALLWDRDNDDYGCYLNNNGVITEVFRGSPTDFPDWADKSVVGGACVLACGEINGAQTWIGDVAHVAVGAGRTLTSSEIEYALVL